MTATVGRRQARRTALFLLYQWDLTGQPLTTLYEGTPDAFARRARGGRVGASGGAGRSGSPRPPRGGPPIGSVRSSGTSCGSPSTSSTARACRRRWRSTRRSCWRSATRRRTRAARERDPGACGQGTDGGGRVSGKRDGGGARAGRGAARAAEDDARGARAPCRRRERGGGGRGAHGARGARQAGRDRAREGARSRGSTLAAGCTVLTSCARSSRAFSTSSS